MPFGGHGESGCKSTLALICINEQAIDLAFSFFRLDGGYMGKDSYDIFTHRRSFINVPTE